MATPSARRTHEQVVIQTHIAQFFDEDKINGLDDLLNKLSRDTPVRLQVGMSSDTSLRIILLFK